MKAFIRGIGNISPQPTFDNNVFLDEIREYNSGKLQVIEPDYKNYIKPIQLRRMGRLLKMGVTAAGIALHDAGIEKPGAIVTGTGLGMMEETEKFLNAMIDNGERLLNPTAFIQSTHNTVGAHIAVMLGCNEYNLTYVHGPVSFENALLDSMMLLEEKPEGTVLTGGVEEITGSHFEITDSMGFWKKGEINNLKLLENRSPGTIAGEGAAFFLLTSKKDPRNYAKISGLATKFNPGRQLMAESYMEEFLSSNHLNKNDIDIVIFGMNGDPENDAIYQPLQEYFGEKTLQTWYKHLCGEHYLASSFALWLGSMILKNNTIPDVIRLNKHKKSVLPKNILICNHYKNLHHSFIFLTSC